jgi:hypothetical protein
VPKLHSRMKLLSQFFLASWGPYQFLTRFPDLSIIRKKEILETHRKREVVLSKNNLDDLSLEDQYLYKLSRLYQTIEKKNEAAAGSGETVNRG